MVVAMIYQNLAVIWLSWRVADMLGLRLFSINSRWMINLIVLGQHDEGMLMDPGGVFRTGRRR
jgi:hypothetical protein